MLENVWLAKGIPSLSTMFKIGMVNLSLLEEVGACSHKMQWCSKLVLALRRNDGSAVKTETTAITVAPHPRVCRIFLIVLFPETGNKIRYGG